MRCRVLLAVLFVASACDDDALVATPDAGGAPDAAAAKPECNPIVGDDCLTPFPSNHFVEAAATATGVRIAIPAAVMPRSTTGITVRPDRLNGKDGFSPSTPFIVYLAGGVDATQLPRLSDLAASTTAASAVQILAWDGGARVPLFAELDANADPATQKQALIIRPQERLEPGRRYIVALVGLRDRSGAPLAPAPFRALRDRTTLPAGVAGLAPLYDTLFARLEAAGVPRAGVSLAWDVTTSSAATSTGNLVKMRDEALAMVAAGQLGYRVASSRDTPGDRYRLREVKLVVEAPRYLESDDPGAFLRFGADGRPAADGKHEFEVVVEIPRCAATATAPLPFVVYGHGLFGTAANNLATEALQKAGDDLCMVLVGNDWIGLSSNDIATIATTVLPDLNKVYIITDRLQQAHVNAQVMTRMLKTTIKDDAALKVGDRAVLDGREAYYLGISNGGIQGGTFLALSPDVDRGVLNVPGCEWSLMIFRSTQFNPLYPVLNAFFPDPLDRQLLVTASQTEWDHSDPASFAAHILRQPLPGTSGRKRVILQESIGDAQVPNMSTRILARAIGLEGFGLVQRVHGIAEVAGPLPSAYTHWDTHKQPPPPDTNVPAPDDNGAHDAVYKLPAAQEQIRRFFRPDGDAENTCNGPCDFP